MNKKTLGIAIVVILLILAVVGVFAYRNSTNKQNSEESNLNNEQKENVELTGDTINGNNENKTLVVYYSAQSHTKAVAEKVAEKLDADIFEIVPDPIYTSEDLNWTNDNSRVSREHNDESLRNVKLTTM